MDNPEEPDVQPTHEDRRRPKAIAPYTALWIITVLCVIFACVALLNQG